MHGLVPAFSGLLSECTDSASSAAFIDQSVMIGEMQGLLPAESMTHIPHAVNTVHVCHSYTRVPA